jgi:hypothetical protein
MHPPLLEPTSSRTTTWNRFVDSIWLSFWAAPMWALALAPFVFALWQVLTWLGVTWPDKAQQGMARWIRQNKRWIGIVTLPFFVVCAGFFLYGHLGFIYFNVLPLFR